MSGSMYDLTVTTFSPEGRIFQVEYATKAVENSETVVGIKCKDGVLLAAEKQVFSKLLVDDSNRRIYNAELEVGLAICGKLPDGRNILQRARHEANDYFKNFSLHIPGRILAERIALYVHQYTIYGAYRPFGAAIFLSSYDPVDGFLLHMIEPSGHVYAYHGYAHGKGRQICKSEIERRNFRDLTCVEALPYVVKMLSLSHEEYKEKKFEYEISWITHDTGYQHQQVPKHLRDQAAEAAQKLIQQDQQ